MYLWRNWYDVLLKVTLISLGALLFEFGSLGNNECALCFQLLKYFHECFQVKLSSALLISSVLSSPQEECRDVVWVCKDGLRTAKARLQLNLAKDVKGNNKGSYNCITSKRKDNEGLLLNRASEKAEVLKATSTSAFTGEICLQKCQARKTHCQGQIVPINTQSDKAGDSSDRLKYRKFHWNIRKPFSYRGDWTPTQVSSGYAKQFLIPLVWLAPLWAGDWSGQVALLRCLSAPVCSGTVCLGSHGMSCPFRNLVRSRSEKSTQV